MRILTTKNDDLVGSSHDPIQLGRKIAPPLVEEELCGSKEGIGL